VEGITPDHNQPDQFIHITCDCGQRIRVPKTFIGKQGKCPKCKNLFTISRPPDSMAPDRDEPIRLKRDSDGISQPDRPVYKTSDAPRPAASEPFNEITGKSEIKPEPPKPPATLLDVFAFPFSLSGIIHLIIFSLAPLVMYFLQLTLFSFCCYGQLVAFGLIILVAGYFYYYLVHCIIAAAKDERRAPDVSDDVPTFGDLARRLLLFVTSTIICYLPAISYIIYCFYHSFLGNYLNEERLHFFNILCLVGLFFYPMFLLAIAMFDSMTALNPILIVASIFSTFLPYCGLALLFLGIGWLVHFVAEMREYLALLVWAFEVYVIFVCAYILGRFYRRYEERLNWEIKL